MNRRLNQLYRRSLSLLYLAAENICTIYSITTVRFVDLLHLLCTGVARRTASVQQLTASDLTRSCLAAKNHFDTMYHHRVAVDCYRLSRSSRLVFFGKLRKIK